MGELWCPPPISKKAVEAHLTLKKGAGISVQDLPPLCSCFYFPMGNMGMIFWSNGMRIVVLFGASTRSFMVLT